MARRVALMALAAVCAFAAAGTGATPALASDGALDPSFGTGGTALYNFEAADNESISQAFSQAVLPDGKILVAGWNGSEMLAARLTSAGALDPSFGTGGAVVLNVHAGRQTEDASVVRSVLVEPDGDVLLVGDAQSMPSYPVIVRLLPDGSVDPSFGNDGTVILNAMDVEAAALAPDGDVVLAGTGSVSSPPCVMLTAVTPSGALDTSFGRAGATCYQADSQLPGHEQSAASAVKVESDGNIDVLGSALAETEVGETDDGFLARFTPSGTLNPSFGQNGIASLAIPGVDGPRAEALALQPDGDIVAAAAGTTLSSAYTVDVLRFFPDGQPDPSFGTGGVAELPGGEDPAIDEAGDSIAIRPDGNVLVSGSTAPYGTGPTDAWLLSSGGQPDPTFADDGEAVLNGDLTTDQAQSDGSVVLAGAAPAGDDFDLAVTRLLGSGGSSSPTGSGPITPPDTMAPGTADAGGAPATTVGSGSTSGAPVGRPSRQRPITRITLHCARPSVAGQPRMGTCTVSFASAVTGRATDRILNGHRTVVRWRQHVRRGPNRASIKLRNALRAGRYRLLITVHAPGGHTSASTADLQLG